MGFPDCLVLPVFQQEQGLVPMVEPGTPAALMVFIALWAAIGAYAVVSWRRGGQTIGMRAWRLRVTGPQRDAEVLDEQIETLTQRAPRQDHRDHGHRQCHPQLLPAPGLPVLNLHLNGSSPVRRHVPSNTGLGSLGRTEEVR